MTDEKILTIMVNVGIGIGGHGDFLLNFSHAVCRADVSNFQILKPAALTLIRKYDLDKPMYLVEE